METINTIHVENFLNRVRIASKSRQNTVVLDIKDAQALSDTLALVMTRLSGELDSIVSQLSQTPSQPAVTSVEMDGGSF